MIDLSLSDLRARVGQEVGVSAWIVVAQDRIDAFADATGDHQWIHVDAERAKAETPFGATIAHGFLTLSLVSAMLRDVISVSGLRMAINYGLNRVRFVSPVPSGSRIRARLVLGGLQDVDDGVQATWTVTIEREGGDRPALVAEWLVRVLFVTSDTQPVRATEQLDWPALERWLRGALPASTIEGLDLSLPMEVEQFPGGHSNLTYHVRFGASELVVRRPPFGPVPPTAHDMAREFRWLSAVHSAFPLAPRVYALCEDPGVIGSIFYVMERRHGIVVRHQEPPQIKDRPEVRRRVGFALVDALADLHAIDIERAGLTHLGKPLGFVERQVRGWTERWHRSKTGVVPEMEALAGWLADQLPPNPARPTVVHGDFKLDNLMLDTSDPARLVAVFDWEMAALGDPLVDLGILLAYWVPNAPPDQQDALTTVTTLEGWPTPQEMTERYAARSGRDLTTLRFFEIFALFKIAVVIQQIYYRFVKGQTDDPRFANFGARVAYLARRATSMTTA